MIGVCVSSEKHNGKVAGGDMEFDILVFGAEDSAKHEFLIIMLG
jgi:hypothetical protein